ncbi:exodeoxyribonuclease V gamma subunit [Candidatus Magnetomoraceae bacterium gMMP-15]
MPKLTFFTSNQTEILIKKISEILKNPLSNPLKNETVIIQSKGMERWICMELAKNHNICANYNFVFPNTFVYDLFQNIIPDISSKENKNLSYDKSPFDPDTMTWKIMELLSEFIDKPAFKSLKIYFGKDNENNLKQFQLARRIAFLFDQYTIFRPEMILKWQKEKNDDWQAILWKNLTANYNEKNLAELRNIFLYNLKKKRINYKQLPTRFSIFGISALPQFHIEIFILLSLYCEVNLFILNPCKEYWGDISDDRKMLHITQRYKKSINELHLEKGNNLLVSLGKLGKDFLSIIYSLPLESLNHKDLKFFKPPKQNNLLSYIQSDILNMKKKNKQTEKTIINLYDKTIQIHSCHNPMREIEILYDNLLAMFENDSDLLPKDIIVMTPDINSYAPFIHAVFNTPHSDNTKIPFSIADRSLKSSSKIISAFLAIINLSSSRFGASEVLTILECKAVQKKFNIQPDDIEIIQTWIEETRIKWGMNSKNKSDLNLPEFYENTWQSGLDRLILGYAMSNEKVMFEKILPFNKIEGNNTLLLGNFIEYINIIFSYSMSLKNKKTLSQWSTLLNELVDQCFIPNQDEKNDIKIIRDILINMTEKENNSGFKEKLEIEVIRLYLKSYFEQSISTFGFLTGNITFCAMLPMRSIPFKIICLIGMNDGAYPRTPKTLGFDLMAQNPKPGDRSRKNDDRYLFLEAIISSRKCLYISYTGQDINDNSEIPPSVLISELIDYIEQNFKLNNKDQNLITKNIYTKHHLQAFNVNYFKQNSSLFSFSKENYEACKARIKKNANQKRFIYKNFSPVSNKIIKINELINFFRHPVKFFLRHRFGIYFKNNSFTIDEREPFILNGLEKYLLEQELLENQISGKNFDSLYQKIKGSGQLPHGNIGQYTYNELNNNIHQFILNIRDILKQESLKPLNIDLNIAGYRLIGNIQNIKPNGLIYYHYANIKPKDLLKIWINHLILNTIENINYPKLSIFAGKKKFLYYRKVIKSQKILEQLIMRYIEGLSCPLHFFPETSHSYAEKIATGKNTKKSFRHAKSIWIGNDFKSENSESKDDYNSLCFKNINPLDETFIEISLEIFLPLLKHIKSQNLIT